MKTAVFYGPQDIRVEDVPIPDFGSDQILVKVAAAGICGSDLHYFLGENPWGPALSLPFRGGHELAGTVVEVGASVEGFHAGDRIGIEPMHLAGCGNCLCCRKGEYQICTGRSDMTASRRSSAGFSEFDLVDQEQAFHIPAHMTFDEAALIDVYACGLHALRRFSDCSPKTIVIVGTGALAFALGQLTKAITAASVILVGRHQRSLDFALNLGAADVVLEGAGSADLGPRINELTDGRGVDLVYEAVGGNGASIVTAVQIASPGGAIGILGAFWSDVRIPYAEANAKELQFRWCNSYSTFNGKREYQIALDLLSSGRIPASALITHHYSLDDIQKGFVAATSRRSSGAIKVIIEPQLRPACVDYDRRYYQ